MQNLPRLLLIDDNEDDLYILRLAFETIREPVQCMVETDSEMALSRLLEQSIVPLPDCIFLDLNMPKVGGMELLAAIRSISLYDDIPVIIHSTSTAQKDIEQAKASGANWYLPKASNFALLCKSLQELFPAVKKRVTPVL
ncbi:response regulator [Pseudoflavitalea sp. X16]|uniref:response regulator n=1 Tax=Paraflavitalea devenefica TaxID=2716334 RepID=UPI0014231DD6|nr:response regulator [Paraflavitalea devenefica]NII26326.1 response regulator [Paraflavitalea devenefica]